MSNRYSDTDMFGAIFICCTIASIVIAIVYFSLIAKNNDKMSEAIDFCGCNDKACIVSYVSSSFSKEEYDKECK